MNETATATLTRTEAVTLDTVPITYIFDEGHNLTGYREQRPGSLPKPL